MKVTANYNERTKHILLCVNGAYTAYGILGKDNNVELCFPMAGEGIKEGKVLKALANWLDEQNRTFKKVETVKDYYSEFRRI